ncbi:MAG: tetratricopeptide repeat protein [Anaerolineales bacterium]|nr:MAG: tetratricopeptide repeat protein [Anaerolineales bacterium]
MHELGQHTFSALREVLQMAHNNRNWPDFIKNLPGWITGFIAFVTAVVGFAKLWQGDTGLVTIVLLAIGAGGGILGCAYLAFKRTPPLVSGGKGTWQYPRWRPWALAGLVIIPLLTAGGVGYHRYQQAQPPTQVILLIADFDGPEPQKYGVTDAVLNKLCQALARYDDVQVEALGRAITEAEGSAAARAAGEERKAAIVIWGWYRTPGAIVPMSVHFEVLRPPKYMPELRPEAKGLVQTMAVAELESFTLQTQLSAEMAYLSLFTVGMARYAAEDWDGAITRFSDALSQTAERVPALDPGIIYFSRGFAYAAKGEYDRGIADYDQAIQLQPDFAEAYSNRGDAYMFKHDYDRAIADYGQAIQLQPDFVVAYHNRGFFYQLMGKKEKAIADFRKVLELSDDPFWRQQAEEQLKALGVK